MIDRAHPLPVVRQVKLVGISRSSAYYAPSPVNAADLALMRRIDELHLEHPFAGARMLTRLFKREGIAIGRKHVGTLRKMGIEALYRKPNLSRKDLAVPAARSEDRAQQPGVRIGHDIRAYGTGFRLSHCCDRLGQPPYFSAPSRGHNGG
jgi:hypothetical protein